MCCTLPINCKHQLSNTDHPSQFRSVSVTIDLIYRQRVKRAKRKDQNITNRDQHKSNVKTNASMKNDTNCLYLMFCTKLAFVATLVSGSFVNYGPTFHLLRTGIAYLLDNRSSGLRYHFVRQW